MAADFDISPVVMPVPADINPAPASLLSKAVVPAAIGADMVQIIPHSVWIRAFPVLRRVSAFGVTDVPARI